MVPELTAEFPDHAPLIDAYASRFNETIPGPLPGSLALVERLGSAGVPLFTITTFGHEFSDGSRPPSEESLVGTECVRPCRSRWVLHHEQSQHKPKFSSRHTHP